MTRSRRLAALLSLSLMACSPPAETGFREVSFPDDFMWGTAIAQWQVEGDEGVNGPVTSNWSRWLGMGRADGEQQNPRGNGFHRLYPEEAARAASLGLTHFRLGVDWSRIEPEPGVYDQEELDHLVDVLNAIRAEGMQPVLTLWHWVVPPWVQNPDPDQPGGKVDMLADASQREDLLVRWEAFVTLVVERVKDRVDVYTVLNEPFSVISAGYIGAVFPPGHLLDMEGAASVGLSLIHMHARAFDVIKQLDDVDADDDGAASFVGITQTANAFYPVDEDDPDLVFAAGSISYVFNQWIMRALVKGELDVDLDGRIDDPSTNPPEGHYPELEGTLEFIGVQYYGPVRVKKDPLLAELHPLYARPLLEVHEYDEELPHNGMGREISAAGFRDTLWLYSLWGVPIVLTENGTTTNGPPTDESDNPGPYLYDQAALYLLEHLWEVGRAIEHGIDIRGYFHWTLSDNFEWVEGRRQRFGAYTVDFSAPELPRTLNPMGEALRDVVGSKRIDEALWSRWALERYPSDKREAGGLTTSVPVFAP